MTTLEIQQGNKLIFEYVTNKTYESLPDNIFDDLTPYHKYWDWLMPVVEKIDNIRLQDKKGYAQSVDFSIFSNICTIETGGYTSFTICTIIKDTKIEAVWTACVEFIQWYNKQ